MNSRWTRRDMLWSTVGIAAGLPGVVRMASALGQSASAAEQHSSPADSDVPKWIAPGKLRWVWATWEPPDLYMRGGYGAGIGDVTGTATGLWVPKWYERMHSDAILDQLAEAGVNLVTTHFYKGFGLRAEAAEMDRAADFTRRAHTRGIRVLGYHQFSTVIYETMLDEVPELAQWIQRDQNGNMRTYSWSSWRWKACPIHDEFIAYLKRVMDHCLIHADMDGVEFDGTSYDCCCKDCTAAFQRFLTERYPQPRERFGLPHFKHVAIPYERVWRDPLWQELIRFRMDVMGRRLRDLRAYVHQRKPGAALVTYVDSPRNSTRLLPDQGDYLDLAVAESHDMPQMLDGALITKVRRLKDGAAIGRMTISTDWLRTTADQVILPKDASTVEQDMAECLACGGQVCAATWALRPGQRRDGSAIFERPEFRAALKRYMGFARDHEDLYTDSQPCANVWMYHATWSLAFDTSNAYNSVVGFEQTLLGRIAYRVAKQAHLKQLGARDVLILASQTCLSDAECAAIRAAVDRGCALIVSGKTGDCDENFRQRERSPLVDLLDKPMVRHFAQCPGHTANKNYDTMPMLPKRAGDILRTVRELAQKGLAAELEGSDAKQPMTYVDVYRQPAACVAHVVHYGDGALQGLRLRVGDWLAHGEPVLYSPHLATPLPMKLSKDRWIKLPESFGHYCAIRFQK